MRIVFLCPPIGKLNGGIKYIFRMAETLCADGFDAVVCEQDKAKPSWFTSNAPLIGYDALQPRQGDILVLPEDQPDMLRTLATWPQRKIIYCQNQFYAALGTTGATSYADYGVTDILCSSQTIRAYCAERHPQIPTHLVPCSVDSTLFKPSAKIEQIAYAPRKRMIESAYLQDMFHHHYPQWRAVPWLELSNLSEAQIAAAWPAPRYSLPCPVWMVLASRPLKPWPLAAWWRGSPALVGANMPHPLTASGRKRMIFQPVYSLWNRPCSSGKQENPPSPPITPPPMPQPHAIPPQSLLPRAAMPGPASCSLNTTIKQIS
jgi:hypothetical protein